MQPDLHSRALAAHTLHQFRTLSPLTHCMTNEVVQSFTANTLLALGASPAMVIEPEEASQFAAIASALLVNVGTLTQERATAMRAAVERAYPPAQVFATQRNSLRSFAFAVAGGTTGPARQRPSSAGQAGQRPALATSTLAQRV